MKISAVFFTSPVLPAWFRWFGHFSSTFVLSWVNKPHGEMVSENCRTRTSDTRLRLTLKNKRNNDARCVRGNWSVSSCLKRSHCPSRITGSYISHNASQLNYRKKITQEVRFLLFFCWWTSLNTTTPMSQIQNLSLQLHIKAITMVTKFTPNWPRIRDTLSWML